jgi:intracellular multiplication protein IcmB
VAIRNRLYARLGASQARRLLAANFPGGSARSEIRRRVNQLADQGKAEEASVGAVIETVVSEMVASTQVSLADLENEDAASNKASA